MLTYIIDYVVGNTYKTKKVKANSVEEACKKARYGKLVHIAYKTAKSIKDEFKDWTNKNLGW